MSPPQNQTREQRPLRTWLWAVVGLVVTCAVTVLVVLRHGEQEPSAESCADSDAPPLDVALVLDASGDMSFKDLAHVRKSASIALINGMDPAMRTSVILFGDEARLVQPLTREKDALVAAVRELSSDGGGDVEAGIAAAVDALGSTENRDRAIILVSDDDGVAAGRSSSAATAAGVPVLAVSTAWFEDGGAGEAAPSAGSTRSLSVPPRDADRDTDGDGLSDCEEREGARDGDGQLYRSDPLDPDSDADGLTDGQEITSDLASFRASAAAAVAAQRRFSDAFRYVVSDPSEADSDGDGLADPREFDTGTQPFSADSDSDDLDDLVELDQYGTDPLNKDSDDDARNDGWEAANESAGFDPIVYDEEVSKWQYARDFAAGAVCPEDWTSCEADSTAFLAGAISGGLLGYKDVLDVIGNLTTLDFVGAGIAGAGLLPIAGDAGSVVSKTVRFLEDVPLRKQVDALGYLAAVDSVPASVRTSVLEIFDGESVRVIKGAGVSDESLQALVRSRIDFRVVARALEGAQRVEKSPRLFQLESEAESYLRQLTPGALPTQRGFRASGTATTSTRGIRFPDIYSETTRTALEVKNGYVRASPFVRDEVAKDVALLKDPEVPVDEVIWHFFPKAGGFVGPDEDLRLLLQDSGIPYVIYAP